MRQTLFFVILLSLVLGLVGPLQPAITAQDDGSTTEQRIDDLLAQMTLDEKIGQMTLVEKNSINPADITRLGIGGLLSGGGGYPAHENSPQAWAEMVNTFQEYALDSRLGIPLIYGVDAVHGHSNMRGATIFPHNVGMGATRNPDLVRRACQVTAQEMVATGIYWNYAPVVAVARDIRWGRAYEAYGEDTALVSELATACLAGLQGDDLSAPSTVIGTPKHYVGDGGTLWGTSRTRNYEIDQGDTALSEEHLRAIHLPPYEAVIASGARSIMISFSSWNGQKLHGHRYLITDVLKDELGFDGFVVSDWQGIDQVTPRYYDAVVAAINAGIDMNMVPYDYQRFMDTLRDAVTNGDVSQARIDDAVRRILRVKFELGLFEQPFNQPDMLDAVGSPEHRAVARQAVAESQVLLKNEGDILPLDPQTDRILVAGQAADDIGIQSGGWTIEWQGASGDITPGTTILAGIQAAVDDKASVVYRPAGDFSEDMTAEVGIAVVGERPYAEGVGDSDDLRLPAADLAAIENLMTHSETVIVILVTGRPLMITDQLPAWDALVVAWLPGTEGQGVADVLFGHVPFGGKLPFTWLRAMHQLPFDFDRLDESEPLFPYGFGLTTE